MQNHSTVVDNTVVHRHQQQMSTPRGQLEYWSRHRDLALLLTETMMGVSVVLPESRHAPLSEQMIAKRREFVELRKALFKITAVQATEIWPRHASTVVVLRLGLSEYWPAIWHSEDAWLHGVVPVKMVLQADVDQEAFEQMIEAGIVEEKAIELDAVVDQAQAEADGAEPAVDEPTIAAALKEGPQNAAKKKRQVSFKKVEPVRTKIDPPAAVPIISAHVHVPVVSVIAPEQTQSRHIGQRPARPAASRRPSSPIPGHPARGVLPLWLPAVAPVAVAAIRSALRFIGCPYPAPARPALLAPPRRVCAAPAIIEHVGPAARYQGIPLGEREVNLKPAWRRKIEPPRFAEGIDSAYPWLEDEQLRRRFGSVLIVMAGSVGAWAKDVIHDHLAQRRLHRSLWPFVRHAVQFGMLYGAIPTSWPPPALPVATVAPEPPAPTAREHRVARAQELNIRGTNRRLEWTEEQDEYLRTHYGTVTIEDIAIHLERTVAGVMIRAKKLELTRKKTLAKKDLYPLTTYARVLKVDAHVFAWWEEMGLTVKESVIRAGTSTCRLVAIKDLVAFLTSRPELIDAKRIDHKRLEEMGGVLPDTVTAPSWKWKRLECPVAEAHSIGAPLVFFAPFAQIQPQCPCCGRLLGRQSIGPAKDRYRLRAKPLEPYQLVTAAGARLLEIVERCGGHADLRQIAHAFKGGIAEITEMQCVRGTLTRMTSKALPLLTCDARPVKGSKKGAPRVFFAITQEGRAALEALRALKSEMATTPIAVASDVAVPAPEPVKTRFRSSPDPRWTRGGIAWEETEDAYLRAHWSSKGIESICEHLSRSPRSVIQHAALLGLSTARGAA